MFDFSVLQKDLRDVGKLKFEKKAMLLSLIAVLFLISFWVGKNISKKTIQSPSGSPSQPASITGVVRPATTLSISPSSKTLRVNAEEEISVTLSKYPVSAIDIVLTFDPTVLTVSNLKNGHIFDTVIQKKVEDNKIIFSAAIKPENANNLKEGNVFSFTVKPKKETTKTTIAFDTKGTITALNGDNTLGSTIGATYKVGK